MCEQCTRREFLGTGVAASGLTRFLQLEKYFVRKSLIFNARSG